MNHACYTNFYQLSKTQVNKFLLLSKWSLGHLIHDAREKSKGDWVTHFDLKISEIIQQTMFDLQMPHYLLSEENWQEKDVIDFNQPLVILDPIDGTSGFRKGLKEFCLSLAVMENGQMVSSWLWNFGTDEEETSENVDTTAASATLPHLGLVSDSEWKKLLWQSVTSNDSHKEKIKLQPCGSIAYKLLLLAKGKCDFVASKQPKNIWDIAGGSHLVAAKGYKLYCENKEVLKLNKVRWPAPLLWCLPQDALNLKNILFGMP